MASTYDIIIIGGGNAGCVLASRLSEVPEVKILLLEAGADQNDNPDVAIPLNPSLLADPILNWGHKTVPQNAYQSRTISHPRGKGLGGSTLVNFNCMTFPDKDSIDNFAALGNEGWTYDEMQPYYRKFHTFHEPTKEAAEHLALKYSDASVHGTAGPVQVSYGNYFGDCQSAWARSFETLGRACNEDPLSGRAIGGLVAPGSIDPRGYVRSHSAAAYLTSEVRQRANLIIITEAMVEQILISQGPAKTAQGVRYTKDGRTTEVYSRHEVLLCGGVFNSPQLLELSGIGAASVLENIDIPQLVDLPGVGENLQDHSAIGVSFESSVPTFDAYRDPARIAAATQKYVEKKEGPFTNATYMMSFMPTISDAGDEDIKSVLDRTTKETPPALQTQYSLIRRIIEDPGLSSAQLLYAPVQLGSDQSSAPVPDQARLSDYFSIFISLSHPFSRGASHAVSASVNDSPEIDPRYFSHPADVEIAARHIQYLQTLISAKPLADFIKEGGRTIPTDLDLNSLSYAKQLVGTGFTTYHPAGTCAMMLREDGGVVDSRLRVYGVKGLRVIDASIFPLVPRGNIQSSVYAVAEKAADLIKEDFGKQ